MEKKTKNQLYKKKWIAANRDKWLTDQNALGKAYYKSHRADVLVKKAAYYAFNTEAKRLRSITI